MNSAAPSIPHYALYGEDTSPDFGEYIHCETIEARSQLYEWEIAAHRHLALSQVLFLASGGADVLLDGKQSQVTGPVLIFAPPGSVHGFRFTENAVGFVLTLSREFRAALGEADPLTAHLAAPALVPLDLRAKRRLMVLGRQLLEAQRDRGSPTRALLERALAESWLRIATAPLARPETPGLSLQLARFQSLLERHYREHLPLSFYAQELGCTERTLSRLTRAAWGITPSEAIHRRIALEARRVLRFTSATCAEVAEELGFEDPSYFSRFYQRMTGRRPSAEKE
ncbi:MAG: hypothetical protein BGO57_06585 [Sphingomonadales bacterium 63-6]|nr:MAG: hypothetical protein BGO57_06585 [Sphingomonadales bacterium 63-6]